MDLRIFTEPHMGASYDEQLALAAATEEAGFDGYFRSDHFLRFTPGDPRSGPTDAWVTLAGLARETRRVRLGTLVTSATFRLPGMLAVQVAEVDAMSGGRVELGLGAGWFETEHTAHGVPFPPLGERFDRLEEQLEIVTGMWATPSGERYSFEGRHYRVVDSPGLPKPAQSPRPPVIVGGAGPRRTPALAARFADEFNVPFHPVEATATAFDRVRAACEAVGRDPGTLVLSVAQSVCAGEREADVARRAERIGVPLPHFGLTGTSEQIAERLARYGELGATRAYLQVLDIDDPDHVRLLAGVLPLSR